MDLSSEMPLSSETPLSKLLKRELLAKCEELGIQNCKSKKKTELIQLITEKQNIVKTINNNVNVNRDVTIVRKKKQRPAENSNKLNVLDLFCGCGGMSKGLTDAGLNVIAGIDVWDKAINSYKKNFHHQGICADLTKLSPETFNKLYNTKNEKIDVIVGGPPCFLKDTLVLSLKGYKKIQDITLEDKLLTHTGKFQDILNLQIKSYSDEIYNIQLKHLPENILCTKEHPFYVREKINEYTFKNPEWVSAELLNEKHYFGMIINTNAIIPEFRYEKENIIVKLDQKKDWFDIGYSIGNGCIKNKQDSNILKNILSEFNLFDDIEGIEDNKNLHIPEWMQDAPVEFIQEFLNGYMNSIGHISIVSKKLAMGIQRLYLKLGQVVSIIKNSNNFYTLEFENDNTYYFDNRYVWIKQSFIKKTLSNKESVYNFEVAIDNSYIVENTIVHNCQGFSIAGKRDIKDPRNSLFMEYVKYLNYFKPKAFIMENVIGILSMKTDKNEQVIDIILSKLGENYNCIVTKLYASDFEVPQNRRRTIIIGIRKNLNIKPTEPTSVLSIEERIPVKNILEPKADVESTYYLSEKALTGIKNKKTKAKQNGNGFGAQFLDFDKPSFTIPARYWKDGYDALVKYSDDEIRRLTILELKRIQSFPDDYVIEGTKKDIIMQIGNAVACKFAYHLGKHLINTLR